MESKSTKYSSLKSGAKPKKNQIGNDNSYLGLCKVHYSSMGLREGSCLKGLASEI